MKRFFTIFLTSLLVLSLAACGGENNDNGKTVDLTAQEVLDKLKTALGDSYECDVTDEQSWLSDYFGLDLSKIDSGASESSSISAVNPSTAVVLKVKVRATPRTPPPCCRNGLRRWRITASFTA